MNKINRKDVRKKLKSVIAITLTVLLTISPMPLASYAAEPDDLDELVSETHEIILTEEQVGAIEAIQEFNDNFVGLVGFEGEFALPDDDTQVPVIVFFESNPASTQVIEAAMEGDFLSLSEAQQIVEDEHDIFRRELSSLFGSARARAVAADYHISIEYRHTFNGVAMTLPANMVPDVAGIDVVHAVFPDFPVSPPEIIEIDNEDNGFYSMLANAMPTSIDKDGNPWGGFQGRARMNADELHRQGIDGEGIIISVIDTGIDWMHPAFAGSFPPAEVINEARIARFGPGGTAGHRPGLYNSLTQDELFNINRYTHGPEHLDPSDPRFIQPGQPGYHQALLRHIGFPRQGEVPEYVFLGRDNMRLWPTGAGNDPRGNPIQRGGSPGFSGSPATWTYQTNLPPGMPGNNPFECSPLYFWSDGNPETGAGAENRKVTYGLMSADPAGTIASLGASSHGTHVSGTILGRPYGDDPGTSIIGIAPAAWGIHYRGLYGSGASYVSVWISGQEWSFLDGAHVVNMSLGQQAAHELSIANVSINNIMLADPTIVFVMSAGNSGTEFFTGSNPGGGSIGLTVSALAEPTRGLAVESVDFSGVGAATFITARDNARVEELGNGNFIINHPSAGLVHDNGQFKIFAMPRVDSAVEAGVPVGIGTTAEFAALYNEHGTDLEGHFVLVRRGETAANLDVRAHSIGLGGVISVNNPNIAPLVLNAGGPATITNVAILQIDRTSGAMWATNIAEGSGYGTFRFTNNTVISNFTNGAPATNTGGLPSTQGFSSRGPVVESFEISPCIGSHGVNVFSAHPRFTQAGAAANNNWTWQNLPWHSAHANSSGTSMSAPHVAGAVALIQHYSREHNLGEYNGMWGNYEIRTRVMNTAIQLDYTGNIYSPFDGARNIDVLAAVKTNTVVFAEYDRVPTRMFMEVGGLTQTTQTTLTGSFSFGGFNRHSDIADHNLVRARTIRAYIQNNSNQTITYTLTSTFNHSSLRTAERGGGVFISTLPLDGATLNHPTTLSVPAGDRVGFDVTINLPDNREIGFYEGFMTVTGGSHDIVLPFAAVTYLRQSAFEFLGLYRPVITTNTVLEGAQNITSNELIMYFTQNWGFAAVFYLIDAEPARAAGLNADNWYTGIVNPIDGSHDLLFREYFIGTTMGSALQHRHRLSRHFPRNRGGGEHSAHERTMRGVIFDGYYNPLLWESPAGWGERERLDREGEFYIGITIYRQSPNATATTAVGTSNMWFWEQNVLVPFYVDNALPEFRSITVNDIEVDMHSRTATTVHVEPKTTFNEEIEAYSDYDIVITGNVFDEWILEATNSNSTFGVWREHIFGGQASNPFRQVNKTNNLALWVLAGENEVGNRPIRANVEPNGDFNVTLHGALTGEEVELNFWLINGYAPVPVMNQVPIGVGNPRLDLTHGTPGPAPNPPAVPTNFWWNVPAVARMLTDVESYFELEIGDGFVSASGLDALLRSDVVFGRHSTSPAVYNIPAEYFNQFAWSGLNVTQFSVTATWDEVPAQEFGLHAFNNGNDNNASLAAAGLIRIWTQLDGANALVPYAGLEITAELPDGTCAMEFVRINRIWNNLNYVNLIDVNKHAPWQTIILTATLFGQEIELELINNRLLGLRAYNNGTDAEVPSMAGNIRIWPLLGIYGNSAPIPMDAVISAVDQNGNNAMEFITINRLWTDAGWQNYNVNFDVTKDAPWQTITFTVTVYGQTVTLELINDWSNTVPDVVFGLYAFNNGNDFNESLAQAGLIRIWTQLDGVDAPIPMNATVVAVDQDGNDAMQFVRINRQWNDAVGWLDYFINFDVNKQAPWQTITFSVTLYDQNVTLELINNRF